MVLGCAATIRLAQSPHTFTLETASVQLRLRPRLPLEERIRADKKQKLRPIDVSLISTVHLAGAEYYSGLQTECEGFDRVLFELIADESTTQLVNGTRTLRAPLQATPELRQLASSYGLLAQVDSLDCSRPNFALADVSRAQLISKEGEVGASRSSTLSGALRTLARGPASRSGGGIVRAARRRLAWALPAPELALLLDDWSVCVVDA